MNRSFTHLAQDRRGPDADSDVDGTDMPIVINLRPTHYHALPGALSPPALLERLRAARTSGACVARDPESGARGILVRAHWTRCTRTRPRTTLEVVDALTARGREVKVLWPDLDVFVQIVRPEQSPWFELMAFVPETSDAVLDAVLDDMTRDEGATRHAA